MDDNDAFIYDASDVSIANGSITWTHVLIGDFVIHLNVDGSGELLAGDDAIVLELGPPA